MQIQNRANKQKSDSSFTLIPNSIISALLQEGRFNPLPPLFTQKVLCFTQVTQVLLEVTLLKKPKNTLSTSSIMG